MQTEIKDIVVKYNDKRGSLIPILQDVQKEYGYLSRESINSVSELTKIPKAEIFGVITFYSIFKLKPQGKYTIRICKGTACHVSGSKTIIDTVRETLKLKPDEDTTDDNLFTVLEVACLGCCSLAPVIMIEDKTYAKLTAVMIPKIIKAFLEEVNNE